MKTTDEESTSIDSPSIKSIAGCIVENIISGSDEAISRALDLAEKCPELSKAQKAAFARFGKALLKDVYVGGDLMTLGHHYVLNHSQLSLTVSFWPPWGKKSAPDYFWLILPNALLCLLIMRAFIYLAEYHADMQIIGAHIGISIGYPRYLKKPYFKAIRFWMVQIRACCPLWYDNIYFTILSDTRKEIFGWKQQPIARKKKLILSRFDSSFLGKSRIDKISRLHYLIFKARHLILNEETAESSITSVMVAFEERPEIQALVAEGVVDLLKSRCINLYRQGTMRFFINSAFHALKFTRENIPEDSHLSKRTHFALNYDLGMAHLASRRGIEASVFFERSLELLEEACEQNALIKKYLAWFRHFLEAVKLQGYRDNDNAKLCLRICIDRLSEVGSLPRFNMDSIHKIKGWRWARHLWSIFADGRRRKVRIEDTSLEFSELRQWSALIGRDIIQNRQRFDGTLRYVEDCLTLIEAGLTETPFNKLFALRGCNIGEFSLPGQVGPFLQMKQAMEKTFSEIDIKETKQSYIEFIRTKGRDKGFEGIQVGLAIAALATYQRLAAVGDYNDTQIFIIYALENLNKQIANLSFSFASIVVDCFTELVNSLSVSSGWSRDDMFTIIVLMEGLFLKLESNRSAILDPDDRAYMEKALADLYSAISAGFFAILKKTTNTKIIKLILKVIIVYEDRAKLRWLRSAFAGRAVARIRDLAIPEELKAKFLLSEEELHLFYVARNISMIIKGLAPVPHPRISSSTRGLVFLENRNENVNCKKDSQKDFLELNRRFIESISMIRQYAPDFTGGNLREIFLPMNIIFGVNQDVPKLWIKFIKKQIIFIFAIERVFKHVALGIEESSRIIDFCVRIKNKDVSQKITETLLGFVDFSNIKRFAKKVYGGKKGNAKRLIMVFTDSDLSQISLQNFILPVDNFHFVHSPNSSLSAKNKIHLILLESIVVICPQSGLALASLEAEMCWRGPRCFGKKYLINEERDELISFKARISECSVLHIIGHLSEENEARMSSLLFFDGVAINLQWITENIQFSKNPVVVLNLCRSGISFDGDPQEPFVESGRYLFDSEFRKESVSYVSVFLSCGASAVIATTRPIEDFAAFLFGWKFSKLAQEWGRNNTEDVFFSALKWCQALRRVADLTLPLNDMQHCYSSDVVLGMKAKFHKALNKFLSDFPDNWTRAWDDFVIFR